MPLFRFVGVGMYYHTTRRYDSNRIRMYIRFQLRYDECSLFDSSLHCRGMGLSTGSARRFRTLLPRFARHNRDP